MRKTLNFDLFMQEKTHQYLDVTIYGKTYKVPMEIPAIVPVMMARAEESVSDTDSTRMVMLAADALFGKENVNEICANGMKAVEFANLIAKVFSIINGTDDDEEEQTLDDESGKKQTSKKSKK